MKKIYLILLTISCIFLISCTSNNKNEKSELMVFAAASLQESMEEIKKEFEDIYDIEVSYNFDSSGTLEKMIEEEVYADIFISANQNKMDKLEEKGLIYEDSRRDLLINKVVLVVPDGNPKDIKSFEDMKEKLEKGDILLSIGNSDVPVGEYAKEILEYFDIDEEKILENHLISYGSNVKEVASQVKNQVVDCGIIYETDAKVENLEIVDEQDESMCDTPTYPIAIIKNTKNMENSEKFIEFLQEERAGQIFEKFGFKKIK